MSNESWLASLQHVAVSELWCVPATHNSGCVAPRTCSTRLPWCWAQTQRHRITEQLSMGVRLLDIRVAHGPDGNLFISHTFLSDTTLVDALADIASFVRQHPTEFVIVSLRNDFKRQNASREAVDAAVRKHADVLTKAPVDFRNKVGDFAGKIVVVTDNFLTAQETVGSWVLGYASIWRCSSTKEALKKAETHVTSGANRRIAGTFLAGVALDGHFPPRMPSSTHAALTRAVMAKLENEWRHTGQRERFITMGKGRDKRKKAVEERPGGRNRAKQDRKHRQKNLEKKLRRENDDGDLKEEDVELLLQQYMKREQKKKELCVEDCDAPSERINATFVGNPVNSSELLLFGGEYWNGERTESFNDLLRYNVDKSSWKIVTSPNSPSPRSSHQVVCYKNYMVTYGGEFTSPSQSQFFHHKDLWRLNVNTWAWEEIKVKEKNTPTARSGHRMVLWKRTGLMFGGFHDTLTSNPIYYDDLWSLCDLDATPQWRKVEGTGDVPSKRSAVNLAIYGDVLYLFGGFSVEGKQRKGITHTDFFSFNLANNVWSRVKKVGIPPNIRSGMAVAVTARKAVFFGGVMDYDDKDDLKSRFFSDMYVFNMDTKRWFPLLLKKKKQVGTKQKKKQQRLERVAFVNVNTISDDEAEEDDEPEKKAGRQRKGQKNRGKGGPQARNKQPEAADEDDSDNETAGSSPLKPAGNPAGEEEEDEEDDDDFYDELAQWERPALPALPAAKKKQNLQQQRVRKTIEAAKQVVESDANAVNHINLLPGAEEGDEAPKGIPIYLGASIVGYEPLPGTEEQPRAADWAEKESLAALKKTGFLACPEYEGPREGFAFKTGDKGLGYYKDQPPKPAVQFDLTNLPDGYGEGTERTRKTFKENESGQIVPCGRFSALATCVGNYMYLYGGQFEDGSREVTLNDLYRLNLNTMETFEVLQEMDLSKQDWYESDEEEDDADGANRKDATAKKGEPADGEQASDESSSSGDEDEESGSSDDGDGAEGGAKEVKTSSATPVGGVARSNKKAKSKREELRMKLGMDEGVPTPETGEALRDFFSRSLDFWINEARENNETPDITAADAVKAFRKSAFRYAAARFNECRPVLEELEKLEDEDRREAAWREKKAVEAKARERHLQKLAKERAD
eukprot:gene190-306_t